MQQGDPRPGVSRTGCRAYRSSLPHQLLPLLLTSAMMCSRGWDIRYTRVSSLKITLCCVEYLGTKNVFNARGSSSEEARPTHFFPTCIPSLMTTGTYVHAKPRKSIDSTHTRHRRAYWISFHPVAPFDSIWKRVHTVISPALLSPSLLFFCDRLSPIVSVPFLNFLTNTWLPQGGCDGTLSNGLKKHR